MNEGTTVGSEFANIQTFQVIDGQNGNEGNSETMLEFEIEIFEI